MSNDFNEKSTDSMFSRILLEVKTLSDQMNRMEAASLADRSRLTKLEQEKWYQRGVVAAVSVGAIACWEYITRK